MNSRFGTGLGAAMLMGRQSLMVDQERNGVGEIGLMIQETYWRPLPCVPPSPARTR